MRVLLVLLVSVAAAGAALASAATTPTYSITFAGTGAEHHVDQQRNIQDDGTCNSAEHVDVTATIAWSVAWRRFTPSAWSLLAGPAQMAARA